MDRYTQIKTKDHYMSLLKSGLFFEFYPQLTGEWDKDKLTLNLDSTKEVSNSKEEYPKQFDRIFSKREEDAIWNVIQYLGKHKNKIFHRDEVFKMIKDELD